MCDPKDTKVDLSKFYKCKEIENLETANLKIVDRYLDDDRSRLTYPDEVEIKAIVYMIRNIFVKMNERGK